MLLPATRYPAACIPLRDGAKRNIRSTVRQAGERPACALRNCDRVQKSWMPWSAGMQYRVASQAADEKQVPDHTHRIKNERLASAKVPKAVSGGSENDAIKVRSWRTKSVREEGNEVEHLNH